jgi:glycerol-3-phosphate dehydrogenase
LTSSPAIALEIRDLAALRLDLKPRDGFKPTNPGFTGFFCDLPLEERMDLVARDPEYGEIICRCERITKREIRDAI